MKNAEMKAFYYIFTLPTFFFKKITLKKITKKKKAKIQTTQPSISKEKVPGSSFFFPFFFFFLLDTKRNIYWWEKKSTRKGRDFLASQTKSPWFLLVRYCTVFSFIVLLYCESYIYKSNM